MTENPVKPSWPLLLAAALSFIPILGFFIAAVAITWALVSSRPKARRALIIAAVGALLTVVEIGGAMLLIDDKVSFRDAFAEVARENLGEVVLALEEHRAANGSYPPDLLRLRASYPLLNTTDQTGSLFSQKRYQYRLHEDGGYDLFAVGQDGEPYTADDVRPVLPDSLLGASGYRPSSRVP